MKVEWRMNYEVWNRWNQLLTKLEYLDPTSDEAWALRDEARHLPGFPTNYDEDRDLIVPVVRGTPHSYSRLTLGGGGGGLRPRGLRPTL